MKNKILVVALFCSLFVTPFMVQAEGTGSVKKNSAVEAPSATTTIEGKVVDVLTGETLVGAEISIEGTEIKVYSDLDGNFIIEKVIPGKYNIICSLISYNKSLVENLTINSSADNKCEIALESSR